MTIPPFGDNISNVTDANTFRVWFDATNSLIQKLNPLIYGITAGVGEVAGITIDINRTTVRLSSVLTFAYHRTTQVWWGISLRK